MKQMEHGLFFLYKMVVIVLYILRIQTHSWIDDFCLVQIVQMFILSVSKFLGNCLFWVWCQLPIALWLATWHVVGAGVWTGCGDQAASEPWERSWNLKATTSHRRSFFVFFSISRSCLPVLPRNFLMAQTQVPSWREAAVTTPAGSVSGGRWKIG